MCPRQCNIACSLYIYCMHTFGCKPIIIYMYIIIVHNIQRYVIYMY